MKKGISRFLFFRAPPCRRAHACPQILAFFLLVAHMSARVAPSTNGGLELFDASGASMINQVDPAIKPPDVVQVQGVNPTVPAAGTAAAADNAVYNPVPLVTDVEAVHETTPWLLVNGDPSMPEAYGTVQTQNGADVPLWRKVMSFVGPGVMISVGYMDPGNWSTDIAGGSAFGYDLLFIVLLSSLIAMFLQVRTSCLPLMSPTRVSRLCPTFVSLSSPLLTFGCAPRGRVRPPPCFPLTSHPSPWVSPSPTASRISPRSQALAVRVGFATGRDLAQCCRDAYPKWLVYILWIAMEVCVRAPSSPYLALI